MIAPVALQLEKEAMTSWPWCQALNPLISVCSQIILFLQHGRKLAMVKGTEPMSVHLLPEYAPFFSIFEAYQLSFSTKWLH